MLNYTIEQIARWRDQHEGRVRRKMRGIQRRLDGAFMYGWIFDGEMSARGSVCYCQKCAPFVVTWPQPKLVV